ncbi:YheC/YheD family endospore coat-associated protein [Ferviditalea candida]|uniref:YheC/YheD family protein n=1 Tax=Ferviditalea candida TaxID=3108399 RepID=A0ABU5ZGX2_9BACL|nr:YheC/YheD family protein [Paenibacillaceae bacterium T2]
MDPEITIHDSGKPVVAILATDDEAKAFRGVRKNFIDLIKAGKKMDLLVYVTTAKNLKLQEKKTIGYLYDAKKKHWNRRWVPFPHVVYNRIPTRKDEMRPEVQHFIEECLQHPDVHIFNPSFFNKWRLIEWLSLSPATKGYIPFTEKFGDQTDLESLLTHYRRLYLKPERGKAGKGIMRISQKKGKTKKYVLSIQEKKSSSNFSFATVADLKSKIREYIGEQPYIIQQGIDLVHNHRRPFDLRVLVQKNLKGSWVITGIGARVAGEASITTHVPRGGSIDDPQKLLVSTFGNGAAAKKILLRVKTAVLAIAQQIERGAGHPLGEMSMDLGLDGVGNIWFFEANSKPMKFDEPHIRKKSLERFMQYCSYLAKSKTAEEK